VEKRKNPRAELSYITRRWREEKQFLTFNCWRTAAWRWVAI